MNRSKRSLWIVGLLFIAISACPALIVFGEEASPADAKASITWSIGLNANFPFLGVSIRYWLDETWGLEFNLAPIPGYDYPPYVPPEPGKPEEPARPQQELTGPNKLDLHVSGRFLFKVSDNPRADFYFTIGPSAILQFSQLSGFSLREPFIGILGEIEISNWPIDRINPVVDYGFALNVQNLYDFRWIAGGVGFHFYFF
jgi:hypothetical protein